jgi:ribosomal protein L11 methyltransferase
MQNAGVAQVSVLTTASGEEPIAALLERLFRATPAIYTDVEKGHSIVTVYSRAPVADLKKRHVELTRGFEDLREIGLDLGSAEVLMRKVPREDWSESWKKYFKTIEIGSALLIKPSWSKQKPKPRQAVVVLDPGLSFGTGQHATTSFCLKQIVAARRAGRKQLSLLDAGCGSGILAIAAAKLGYVPVEAFDFDPVAVRVALKNCRSNRVEKKVKVSRKDLTKLPLTARTKYEVICANLTSDVLIDQRDKLLNRLAPDGTIVLAGILETEFAKVRTAYETAGLRLVKTRVEREWQSGAFVYSVTA